MMRFLALLGLALAPLTSSADVVSDLAAFAKVRTTSREVALFSWAGGARGSAYAYSLKQTFWKPAPDDPSALGPGLYAAIDPIQTRKFGGRDGTLFQLAVPKGIRFLVIDPLSTLPAELSAKLASAGCDADSMELLFLMSVGKPRCRELRDALVRKLDLSALRYSYPAQDLSFCASRPQAAFVLFDDRALNLPQLQAFRTTGPAAPMIEALFEAAGSSLWSVHGTLPDPQPWAKEHLWGCGGYAEDL